ncbi:hypothetical protein PoB_006209200 [Plakobranchus ocellatus]|uniref:Uncharacterized protein n=1 Tax=Plakobranchus ocellatus TaxID=259542 RepID=A0AAV4CUJ9_9GAST|nr:hypothetical protein PoB_006209200 [Plakobranchus ocellatus]
MDTGTVIFKLEEGESAEMFIVRIKTYLKRLVELGRTKRTYDPLRNLFVREQFMDACPEDLAMYVSEKVLRDLGNFSKEADLYLLTLKRDLYDQPRRSGARPMMETVRPREHEKRDGDDQCAGELKTRTNNQRSCFKCKDSVISLETAHIQAS